jgi:hypothetical protein
VNGEEQTMSREVWRQLPEQRVQEKDRIRLDHYRKTQRAAPLRPGIPSREARPSSFDYRGIY